MVSEYTDLDPTEREIFSSYAKELDIEIEERLAKGESPSWMETVYKWAKEETKES